jgi:hypothetical protein
MRPEDSALIFSVVHDFLLIFGRLGFRLLHHLPDSGAGSGLLFLLVRTALGFCVRKTLLGSLGGLLHGRLCFRFSSHDFFHCIQRHDFTAFT